MAETMHTREMETGQLFQAAEAEKAMTPPGRRTPTAAQRRVLEAMRDGAPLVGTAVLRGSLPNKYTSGPTKTAMWRAGWIAVNGMLGGNVRYTITALGRAALHPAADDAGVK